MAAFRIHDVSAHRSGHWEDIKRFSRRLLGAENPATAFVAIPDACMLLGWALRNVCAHGSSAEAAALLFEAGVSLADPTKAEWGKEASLCENGEGAAEAIANGLLSVLVKLQEGGVCQLGELAVLVPGAVDRMWRSTEILETVSPDGSQTDLVCRFGLLASIQLHIRSDEVLRKHADLTAKAVNIPHSSHVYGCFSEEGSRQKHLVEWFLQGILVGAAARMIMLLGPGICPPDRLGMIGEAPPALSELLRRMSCRSNPNEDGYVLSLAVAGSQWTSATDSTGQATPQQ